ncbi:MAG: site-specific DNA-methyltransferase [Clostridia bacterium]|nr:site-specific DNA-methyltransferase [Clostridia bacterium]
MDKLIKEGVQVDLTVTSPPYDNLRTYEGSLEWNETIWKQVIEKLYKITAQGGVVVWVVGDATIKGSETGTSFKQALYFKECGFNLHDTMIYIKNQLAFPDSNRYYNAFEYMFVFSKGSPKTFNPIKDRKNVSAGRDVHGCERNKDGSLRKIRACAGNIIKEYGVRWNYWLMYNQSRGANTKHPASFPEQLANDHIISWSNPNDVVFDPFMGSGTTGKMALLNNRNFIGIEKVEEYYKLSKERIKGDV